METLLFECKIRVFLLSYQISRIIFFKIFLFELVIKIHRDISSKNALINILEMIESVQKYFFWIIWSGKKEIFTRVEKQLLKLMW